MSLLTLCGWKATCCCMLVPSLLFSIWILWTKQRVPIENWWATTQLLLTLTSRTYRPRIFVNSLQDEECCERWILLYCGYLYILYIKVATSHNTPHLVSSWQRPQGRNVPGGCLYTCRSESYPRHCTRIFRVYLSRVWLYNCFYAVLCLF